MLKHLYIKNYALIDVLDIDFATGFSVITGETGAGKSIILGAIGLLLGQRADSKAVKTNTQKCTIEARFDISRYGLKAWFEDNDLDCDEDECILRRELTAAGKSRAFINDTPTSLQLMRELGEMLVDVHSQHQNLLLQKEDFQVNVLDIIADNGKQKEAYSKAFAAYRKAENDLKAMREQISLTRENEEFMRFQLNELANADLKEDEQEALEQEQEAATHTEDIKTILFETNTILNDENSGALAALYLANQKLESVARLYPAIKDLAERMSSSFIELKDIAQETEAVAEDIDFNPERLAFINERLDTIYSLQRKFHKNTIAELIEEQRNLQEAIDNIDNSDTALADLEAATEKALLDAKAKADKLTETRQKTTAKVEKAIRGSLEALGMPNVEFKIEITKDELSAKGQDRVAFLFSANKGMAPRPVAQVASGGEIARLMLSLKALISGAVKLPTIIFDEIDTGVSGRVAEKMADIMRQMGNADRQVISITHLPQIAALGTHHYKVEKHDTQEGTTSVMRQLADDERINEIAQMLSGSDITEAARTNAKALLKM
ncbi:MAG: DNA repair protein RecN [Prevotellaceae bacterium]|nr:DNA repair protein RecN [Prevotellaceae bacterium]MDY2750433.1 DNA repair protein RecN [Prevotella sp.]